MSQDQPLPDVDASEADLQEQLRDEHEEGFDPEDTAGTTLPDLDGVDANPADVHEQLIEVPAEDDEYTD